MKSYEGLKTDEKPLKIPPFCPPGWSKMGKILKNGQKTGKNGQKCPKLNFFEKKLIFGSKNQFLQKN